MKYSTCLSFSISVVTLVVSSTTAVDQYSWTSLRHRDITHKSYWIRDLDQKEWISSLVPRAPPKSSGNGAKSPGNTASKGGSGSVAKPPSNKSAGSKSGGSVKQGQVRPAQSNPTASQSGKNSQGGARSKRPTEELAREPPAQRQKKSLSGPSSGAAKIGGRVAGTSKSAFQKIPAPKSQNPSAARPPAVKTYGASTSPARSRAGSSGAPKTVQNSAGVQGAARVQGQSTGQGSGRLGKQGSAGPTDQRITKLPAGRTAFSGGKVRPSTGFKSNILPPATLTPMQSVNQRPGRADADGRGGKEGKGPAVAGTGKGEKGEGRTNKGGTDIGGGANTKGGDVKKQAVGGSRGREKAEKAADHRETSTKSPASGAQIPESLGRTVPWNSARVGNSAANQKVAVVPESHQQGKPTQDKSVAQTGAQAVPVQAEIPNRRIVSGQGASARPVGIERSVEKK